MMERAFFMITNGKTGTDKKEINKKIIKITTINEEGIKFGLDTTLLSNLYDAWFIDAMNME